LINTSITSNEEITLSLEKEYIKDDFFDDSNISFKKNLIFDNKTNSIKLLLINKTFGGKYYDSAGEVRDTPDGGYIIIGTKYIITSRKEETNNNRANNEMAWLIKTDKTGKFQWDKLFGGNNVDIGTSINVTSDGGYIIGGFTGSYGHGGYGDAWLIKTDYAGNQQWSKTYGEFYSDTANDVIQTSGNEYVLLGSTSNYGSGKEDFWLIKTDNKGNEQWNKTFGGIDDDIGYSIQQTIDGGFILNGITWSFGKGNSDIWIIKIDNQGNMIWNKTFGGSSPDQSSTILQTSDGGYIITGERSKALWVIKTDSSGNIIWNKTYGGPYSEFGSSILQLNGGKYIISGFIEQGGMFTDDVWLIKINQTGFEEWNKTYGGYAIDRGMSVIQTSDNGFLILGETASFGAGNSDIWMIKTDSFGNDKPIGNLSSNNILVSQNNSFLNTFFYTTSIPFGTNIKVQFSQNNMTWYNSKGILNGWDSLENGEKSIDLSNLSWHGSNFYYRMNFLTNSMNIPELENIKLLCTRYSNSGTFISQPFNASGKIIWKIFNWNVNKSKNTDIEFQLRTSKTKNKLSLKEFIGPDGKNNAFYKISGSEIWSGHNNDGWIQFKVYLSTTNSTQSPILKNVTLSFNYYPEILNSNITPKKGNIIDNFNFTFTYLDKDNDLPDYLRVCIDHINYTMIESNNSDKNVYDGKDFWYTTKLKAGNHDYQFFATAGDLNCSTNKNELIVNKGPLNNIIVKPFSPKINISDFQIFNASGFDIDNNILSISPQWSANGGGKIDQFGNFTPLVPGKWIIYANVGNLSGNTTITVIDNYNGNETNNKTKEQYDSDNDNIPDEWEKKYNFNISNSSDAHLDPDNDNLTNFEEYLNQTNPLNPDSDNDSILDGDEIKTYQTNPLNSDTDDDNFKDGLEINNNTNPLDDKDFPLDNENDKKKKKNDDYSYLIILVGIIITIIILFLMFILLKRKKEKS
jgi:hypothetical protein